jgi:acetate kinase
MSENAHRGVLVLNLGSATLKAARYDGSSLSPDREPQALQRIEIALVKPGLDPGTESEALLIRAIESLGLRRAPEWVGHRMVHGGDAERARPLDEAEIERLDRLSAFAPLHQPAALRLVRAVSKLWPHTRQYADFDTLWHARLPANTRRLAVSGAWHELGIRRYGFHGLAYASAMRQVRRLSPPIDTQNAVLAHLGSGCSLCAVRDGHSLDTTMASTPLDGLPMATRSGSLDPGALLHLLRTGPFDLDTLESSLYHQCGLLGMSGLSGDVRELLASDSDGAALALDIFALRVAQGIASMATRLGGIDHLIFSGGIGAHSSAVRAAVAAYLAWLGIDLDESANARGDARIDGPASRARIWRVDVDEESEIASACATAIEPYGT